MNRLHAPAAGAHGHLAWTAPIGSSHTEGIVALSHHAKHRRVSGAHRRTRHRRPKPPARRAASSLTLGAIGAIGIVATVGGSGAELPRPVAADSTYHPSDEFLATPRVVPLDLIVAARHGLPRVPRATLSVVSLPVGTADASTIPRVALAAYVAAASAADQTNPGCHLGWQLLAGIGYIESGHARSGGSAAANWTGEAAPPILGPILDGHGGIGQIADTDHGSLDGDPVWDRAVGPMQFIPSTWERYGADGNHDGVRDPQNIWDATVAAAGYLCAAATGLDEPANEISAVYSYNHSFDYVRAVLTSAAAYLNVDPALLGIGALPTDAKSPTDLPSAAPSRGAATSASPVTATPPPSSPPVTPSASASPSGSPTPSASTSDSPVASAHPTRSPIGSPSAAPTAY